MSVENCARAFFPGYIQLWILQVNEIFENIKLHFSGESVIKLINYW